MSDIPPRPPGDPRRMSSGRLTTLIVVGAIGIFLVVSGLIGTFGG